MWLLVLALAAPAAPLELSLDAALHLVVERNADLKSAELAAAIREIDTERARLDRFSAGLSATAGAGTSALKASKTDATHSSDSTWDVRGTVSVPLYAGGSVRANIDQADASFAIAHLNRAITERELVRATYTAYWTLKGYDLQIGATEEGLSVTEQALAIIRSKADAGLAAGIDVNRSTVDLYAQRETLVEQRAARVKAEQELLRLLQMPDASVVLTDEPPIPSTEEVVLPASPDAGRPELGREKETVAQASATVHQARSATLPWVSLWGEAGLGTSLLPTSPAFDDGIHEPAADASAGLSLSWDLFDLLTTRDAVRQARLAQSQAEAGNTSERARIAAEIRSAAADVDQLRRRAPLVRDQVALARDNLQIVQDLYSQGSASILDLFNAQTAFRQARIQEAGLAVELATAECDLRWLLGQDPRGTP
jgi:outer membrane protein TolC